MIEDDGNRLVIEVQPWLIWRLLGGVFGVLTVLMPLILILSLVLPPNQASIDCDRARGTCVLAHAAWKKDVAIGDIAAAKLIHRGAGRNTSASASVEVQLKSGDKVSVSESIYHPTLIQAMEAAVSGLNRFLDGGGPRFHAEYQSSDTDWSSMVPMAIIAPLVLWVLLRLWVSRRVEVDRAARTLRVRVKRKLRRAVEDSFSLDDLTELTLFGYNWGQLVVMTKQRGARQLIVLPNAASTRTSMGELIEKLSAALGVPFNAADPVKKAWRL
jgi:hypothetical protein